MNDVMTRMHERRSNISGTNGGRMIFLGKVKSHALYRREKVEVDLSGDTAETYHRPPMMGSKGNRGGTPGAPGPGAPHEPFTVTQTRYA